MIVMLQGYIKKKVPDKSIFSNKKPNLKETKKVSEKSDIFIIPEINLFFVLVNLTVLFL